MRNITINNITKLVEEKIANTDLFIGEIKVKAGNIIYIFLDGDNGVTIDSLIKTEQLEDGKVILPAPKGKNVWGSVVINERGQVVIPKAAREHFQLKSRQRLILLSEDGEGFALVPAELFEKKMEQLTKFASAKI